MARTAFMNFCSASQFNIDRNHNTHILDLILTNIVDNRFILFPSDSVYLIIDVHHLLLKVDSHVNRFNIQPRRKAPKFSLHKADLRALHDFLTTVDCSGALENLSDF